MDIDIEQLIAEVFRRPELWNKRHRSYNNRFKVEKGWQEVEATLKHPKGKLKKKWKGLRDQFRLELKKVPKLRSGVKNYEEYVTWSHFKALLFLKDQIKARTFGGNSMATIKYKDSVNEENGTLISDVNHDEAVEVEPPKKQLKTVSNKHADMLAIKSRRLETLEQNIRAEACRDADKAFFDSLLPYMRSMDMHQKMLCRMQIQQIVYDHAFPENANAGCVYEDANDNNYPYTANSTNDYETLSSSTSTITETVMPKLELEC